MSSSKKDKSTLKKCQLILGLFEDMFPRPYLLKPREKSTSKAKQTQPPFKFSNQKKMTPKCSHSRASSKSNSSFTSIYSKESRLDRIMKIKPSKGTFNDKSKSKCNLNTSFSSSRSNKQNKSINNVSRLEKIMNLKVSKPQVSSTLKLYKPHKSQRSTPVKKQRSSILEQIQCRKQIQRQSKQKQKEDRLWTTFQRERSLWDTQAKKDKQKKYVSDRRVQKKVQSLVEKTMNKIKTQKEIALRKKKIFNDYLF